MYVAIAGPCWSSRPTSRNWFLKPCSVSFGLVAEPEITGMPAWLGVAAGQRRTVPDPDFGRVGRGRLRWGACLFSCLRRLLAAAGERERDGERGKRKLAVLHWILRTV